MNVIGKYLKDESGNYISPIVSISTIFDENNSSLRIDPGLPVGSGCDYYGSTAPDGYLFADGSEISRTEYAELFEVIGETYGTGDGSTTFNLPDKRERVSVMYKSGSTNFGILGKKLGADTHTLTTSQMPSHTHKLAASTFFANNEGSIDAGIGGGSGPAVGTIYNPYVTYVGGGTPHNNIQQSLVCNYIIKAYSIAANSTATILAALEGEY